MRKIWHNYLTEDEFRVLLFLMVLVSFGLILEFTGLFDSQPENSIPLPDLSKDYEIKYDLRTISFKELISIPGIGPKRAEDIIQYREEAGFRSKLDLIKVKGIGKATLAKIENFFLDFGVEYLPENAVLTEDEYQETNSIEDSSLRINLNSASLEELTHLKGIGPAKAEKIINLRKQLGKFEGVEDILQVKGIGLKTLDKFRNNVYVGGISEE